ncbi:MAG: hypothetical protein ACLGIA_11385 [Actinomycetes bacterium]
MSTDPRVSLDRLIAALEEHLAAAQQRRGERDPGVEAAYRALADAFESYDEALYQAYDEITPFVLYDDVEDEREDADVEYVDLDEDDGDEDDGDEDDGDEDDGDDDDEDVDDDDLDDLDEDEFDDEGDDEGADDTDEIEVEDVERDGAPRPQTSSSA